MKPLLDRIRAWLLDYLASVRQLRREIALLRDELHRVRVGIDSIHDSQKRTLQDLHFLRARTSPGLVKR